MITKSDISSLDIFIKKHKRKFISNILILLKNYDFDSKEIIEFLYESVESKIINKDFIKEYTKMCRDKIIKASLVKISDNNPWLILISRSKYLETCKVIHEILIKDFATPNQLHKEFGISRRAFNYAMYHYFIKGIPNWTAVSKRVGREVAVKVYEE